MYRFVLTLSCAVALAAVPAVAQSEKAPAAQKAEFKALVAQAETRASASVSGAGETESRKDPGPPAMIKHTP